MNAKEWWIIIIAFLLVILTWGGMVYVIYNFVIIKIFELEKIGFNTALGIGLIFSIIGWAGHKIIFYIKNTVPYLEQYNEMEKRKWV